MSLFSVLILLKPMTFIPFKDKKPYLEAYNNWKKELELIQNNINLKNLDSLINTEKEKYFTEKPSKATRECSSTTIEAVTKLLPEIIGGSADLSGSNNTKTKNSKIISSKDFSGNYIHYGIREHGMAAAMNGLALYGGLIPYGGTFLIFSDYCKPSIRLSALMGLKVIYIFSHDSIGLGEDGPTHQPVEQLAGLRAIPNLNVFRPADINETLECWQIALKSKNTPSAIALSRQKLPYINPSFTKENKCDSSHTYLILQQARKYGRKKGTTPSPIH